MTSPALVAALAGRGQTIAAAESLTGGLVVATIVDVPGASDVVAGGIVAYTADAKHRVLGVEKGLLDERGTVDPDVAVRMAERALEVFHADWAVSTTGVAGPGPHEGHPAGTVFVGVAGTGGASSTALTVTGGRAEIRRRTVDAALTIVLDAVTA